MRLNVLLYFLTYAAVVLADLRGDLNQAQITAVLPGDGDYNSASKAYNQRFNSVKPAAIVYPNNAGDVSKAVTIARNNKIPVSARSGGHSYVANGLGGKSGAMVIDMSRMKGLTIDFNSKIATIETGNRLGNVVTTLNNAGRAMPHGTCPYVGIGGHASYGGFGFASRLWGLTVDTIEAVNIVLANGTQARVSATSQPDLFWAARGAGPSFGIITSFESKTYTVPTSAVYFSKEWNLSPQQVSAALQGFQTYPQQNTLPKEMGAELVFGPGSSRGTISLTFTGIYYGAGGQSQARTIVNPFIDAMKLPDRNANFRGDGTYIDTARILAESDGGLDLTAQDSTDTFYAKSLLVPEGAPLSQSATDQFASYIANQGFNVANLDYWFIAAELFGGKGSQINAVPVDSNSFARRDGLLVFQVYASSGPDRAFPENGFTFINGAVNAMVNAMPTSWNYGAYTNYLEDRLSNWQQRYFGPHYDRLKTIKAAVDPNNVFSSPFGVEGGSSTNPPTCQATNDAQTHRRF